MALTFGVTAVRLSADRYRIVSSSVFVYGLAVDDEVAVGTAPGGTDLWVARVVKSGRHWNSRIRPQNEGDLEPVAEQFNRLGCIAYATSYGLVVVDVPPSAVTVDVVRLLHDGTASGAWLFDHGITPEQAEAGDE